MKRMTEFSISTIGDLHLLGIDIIKCSKCGKTKELNQIYSVKGKIYIHKYNEPTCLIVKSKQEVDVVAICNSCVEN